ncbi:MAG: hypothetical protein L3K08_05805 [Thermoplasmata archaeon]|nr:hypothetical protein [Thermoplasmata archaeon]
MSASSSSGNGPKIASAILAVAFLAVVVLLFVFVYLAVKPVFNALIDMGVIALVLALLAYFFQSFSRDPIVQRSLGWGFGAMGFVILIFTIWLEPASPALSATTQVAATMVIAVAFLIAAVFTVWRTRSLTTTQKREEHRAQWDQSRPPSAFEYAAARAPGTSGVGSPPNDTPATRSP